MMAAGPALSCLLAVAGALPTPAGGSSTGAYALQVAPSDSSSGPSTYPQRGRDDEAFRPSRRADARHGLLLSFGLGGGSAHLSNEGPGRTGAFDLDFRLGYG